MAFQMDYLGIKDTYWRCTFVMNGLIEGMARVRFSCYASKEIADKNPKMTIGQPKVYVVKGKEFQAFVERHAKGETNQYQLAQEYALAKKDEGTADEPVSFFENAKIVE